MKNFESALGSKNDTPYVPRGERPGFENSASGGRSVEREFVDALKQDESEGNAEDIRNALIKTNDQIQHMQTSIEMLVSRMEAGRKLKGAEELQMKLAEETNAEKNILLGEKMKLEEERKKLEMQLENI